MFIGVRRACVACGVRCSVCVWCKVCVVCVPWCVSSVWFVRAHRCGRECTVRVSYEQSLFNLLPAWNVQADKAETNSWLRNRAEVSPQALEDGQGRGCLGEVRQLARLPQPVFQQLPPLRPRRCEAHCPPTSTWGRDAPGRPVLKERLLRLQRKTR